MLTDLALTLAEKTTQALVPKALPEAVVRLRMQLFTRINGDEGHPIPGPDIAAAQLKSVYAHPAADGRSRGAALSDLFWYWLSPGPELHQEHLEPGPRYDEVAQATRAILTLPRAEVEALATRLFAAGLDRAQHEASGSQREPSDRARLVRLRDLWMPSFADFYHQLVLGRPASDEARALIVANADDVVTALKCLSLRHMRRRHALTRWLVGEIGRGGVRQPLPPSFSVVEQALYLQGVFFNTAIVQMAEAMAHLSLFVAQHAEVQASLAERLDDDRQLDRVVTESLRVHPLFGIAHRITSAAITVDHVTLPAGTVVCFDYPGYHRAGFADADRFDPDRWLTLSTRDTHYIPFGVAANRPCPAQAIATITMRVALRELLRRYALHSSVAHTRSLPNRGPCLLVPRARPWSQERVARRLRRLALADRWSDVGRALTQLVLGTIMVLDARRQKLCQRYFENQPPPSPAADPATETTAPGCPYHAQPTRTHGPATQD